MKTHKQGNPKLAVGYIRVSTDEQHLGPEAQRAALERWCEANGAELVAVHVDFGVSGGASLDERPALMDAMRALAESKAGVLLVAKRDRLARDTMVAAMLHVKAAELGACIVSADGMGNGDEPADVLMRQMLDAFAQYERAIIRARTRAALAVKRQRGEWLGGDAAPYGFRLAADGKHLEAEPTEQATLAAVRELRGSGMSLRSIAKHLAEQGRVSRTGKPFAASQIQRMSEAA